MLPPMAAGAVLKLFLPLVPSEDKMFWEHEYSGEFSVRSSYRLIKQLDKWTSVGESSEAGD